MAVVGLMPLDTKFHRRRNCSGTAGKGIRSGQICWIQKWRKIRSVMCMDRFMDNVFSKKEVTHRDALSKYSTMLFSLKEKTDKMFVI